MTLRYFFHHKTYELALLLPIYVWGGGGGIMEKNILLIFFYVLDLLEQFEGLLFFLIFLWKN